MAGKGNSNRGGADDRVQAMAEVMGDPVRAKILFAVAEASPRTDSGVGAPAGITVRQIAARVEESPRRVRYHLSRLVDEEFVTLTGKRMRRGVEERYYRATEVPIITLETTVGGRVSTKQQQRLTLEILKAIFADAKSSLAAEVYNRRPEWIANRIFLEVDEQGWKELSAIQETAAAESQEVLKCVARRSTPAADRFPVILAQLLFEFPTQPLSP